MDSPEGSNIIYLNNEKGRPKTNDTPGRKQTGRGVGGSRSTSFSVDTSGLCFRHRRS